jgi:hypothetical protein
MKVGSGVKASYGLSLLVTGVGIAYGATLMGELECNLATGIYFRGKVNGISHQKVNPSLAAESISEDSQGIPITKWASTSRRVRRWIANVRVTFGATDLWELVTGDKPACVFFRTEMCGFSLQQPSDTSATRVVISVESPSFLVTFGAPTVRRVLVSSLGIFNTASWITRPTDVWELDPGDTTARVLFRRIRGRKRNLQKFDTCTTCEVFCVAFPNGVGTTRATAFARLFLATFAALTTTKMTRAAAERSGLLPLRARAFHKVCGGDLASTDQKEEEKSGE